MYGLPPSGAIVPGSIERRAECGDVFYRRCRAETCSSQTEGEMELVAGVMTSPLVGSQHKPKRRNQDAQTKTRTWRIPPTHRRRGGGKE